MEGERATWCLTFPQKQQPVLVKVGISAVSAENAVRNLDEEIADWDFDHELQIGEKIIFEDMIHYTMVKTTMFNGVSHPSIAIARRDGRIDVVREFGYEDYKNRMG